MESLIKLYTRDIQRLRKEIEAFEFEYMLWTHVGGISNPSGNLCLHLIGNLNTYIGAKLGNSGYIRNRPAEFESTTTQQDLFEKIDATEKVVVETLKKLTSEDLAAIYPEEVLGYEMTTEYFLIHLLGHLNYHLGQINYHRRIVVDII